MKEVSGVSTMGATAFHGSCPKSVIEWEDGGASYRIVGRTLDTTNHDEDGEELISACFYVECLRHDAMDGEKWMRLEEIVPSSLWLYSLLMKLMRGE